MKKPLYIDPFKTEEVKYWTRKWHTTPVKLYNAIMDTGSNNISILKKCLLPKESWIESLKKAFVNPFRKTE